MDKPEPLSDADLIALMPEPTIIDQGRFGICWNEQAMLAFGRAVAARYEAQLAGITASRDQWKTFADSLIDAGERREARIVELRRDLERARATAEHEIIARQWVEAQRDQLQKRASQLKGVLAHNMWVWEGNGRDHLESMSAEMIVAIRADRLRELLSQTVAEMERERDIARTERDVAQGRFDRTIQILTGIHKLLDPPPIEHEGRRFIFTNPNAAAQLHALSQRIRAIPEQIDAAHAAHAAQESRAATPWHEDPLTAARSAQGRPDA